MVSLSALRLAAACAIALGPTAALAATVPAPFTNSTHASYDYIIVGGGTAGLTLAARLSANPATTVLVIEAGPSVRGNDLVDIPGLLGGPFGSDLDWAVNTVPQASSNGHTYYWPRGKLLGGSSALNFMVWNRAGVAEYNAWETLGNKGWNWKNLFPYFKKTENYHPSSPALAAKFDINPDPSSMGTNGPIQVSEPGLLPTYIGDFTPTLKSLGIPEQLSPLSGNNIGVSWTPSSINPTTRARSYSASAYYWPIRSRKNLSVVLNATVTNIKLFGAHGLQVATGVKYALNSAKGNVITVNANKEVILSAGSIQTPQLLELSGIGQTALLAKLGIMTKINLPGVGENLQDHTLIAQVNQIKDGLQTLDACFQNATVLNNATAAWHAGKQSALDLAVTNIAYVTVPQISTSSHITQILAQAKKDTQTAGKYSKQSKILLNQLSSTSVGQLEIFSSPGFAGAAIPPTGTYVTFVSALQHPFSRGTIHINNTDPFALPIVDPRYFEKQTDLLIAVEGAKFLRKVAATAPYKDLILSEITPGPSVQTDAQYAKWVKDTSQTEYHPLGTASMLPLSDGGVVDTNCKVYGTRNLRVIDASVIPIEPAAHIQNTVYALAERCYDLMMAHPATAN